MENTSYSYNKTSIKRKLSAITFATIGLFFLSYGVFQYFQWINATEPEQGDIKGTQEECEDLSAINLWKSVETDRKWYLITDNETVSNTSLPESIKITSVIDASTLKKPKQVKLSYTIIQNSFEGSLSRDKKGDSYSATIPVSQLSSGTYEVQVNAENSCSTSTSPQIATFTVSYPVYVVWSIDWEGSDVKQQYLNEMNQIADTYGMPMTHFFNPRIYLPSVMSKQRSDYLTNYVLEGKEKRGDAIGLHLHMFPDMVTAAGVTPQYSPAWGWSRTDGYDILVSGYSYDKLDAVVKWSIQTFENNGLERPVMFRAGGWFADEGTLRVMEDNDFVLDSSGRTAYNLGTNNVTTHWSLSETAQPYRPSYSNQNSVGNPGMKLWEFPNNGGDSWSFSQEEMFARYRLNYSGGTAEEVRVIIFLSHPDWFNVDKPKMEGLLGSIQAELYQSDSGPVIFTTLEEIYQNMAEVE